MGEANLPSSFRVEGRRLRGPVPADFEEFYRANLRYRTGRRVRAMDLAGRYQAWAEQRGAQSIHLKAMRCAMVNIGHRHIKSNGMFYEDVAFADELPGTADNYPAAGLVEAEQSPDIIRRLDAVMTELSNIRSQVRAA